MLQIKSESSEQTEQLATRLGKALKGGEVIELVSDIGGGKTTFVRGLAQGADSKDKVASPTFTVNKIYSCPKFQIHHFDFYRLPNPGPIVNELEEVLGDQAIVTVIEWAEVVQHVLPQKRLQIVLRQLPNGDRQLTFRAPKQLTYLLEALQ